MASEGDGTDQRAVVRLERAIVLMLLRDPGERWSRPDIDSAILERDPAAVEAALRRLEAEGVVEVTGRGISVTRAIRHLDALSMIGI